MLRMLPGDPAQVLAGQMASQEDIKLIRHQLGLDRPIIVQYGLFLSRLARFDLGRSARTRNPVIEEVWARLPNTMLLAVAAITLACLFGIPAGIISATRPYTWIDYLFTSMALLPFFGLAMNLGPIAGWGLNLERNHITVNPQNCATSAPGIFAIGDIAAYPGKLNLILCGFAEPAMAAHAAHPLLHPNEALHFEYSTSKGVPGS